jgi:hypothetical protein
MLKALMQEMPGVDDASLGAVSVEVDGAGPHPGDDTGGSLRDLVMCCTSIGVPESATLGDAALAPGSSSPVGLGVSGLLLLGSLDFPPCISTGGGWRTPWSSRVHKSPPRGGCCMRCWPRSAVTSYV